LLFLHGGESIADWWSFIAPFFAADYRVVAFSFSGMGRSGWRQEYSADLHALEAIEVAKAYGLFNADVKPAFVSHSYGGQPLLIAAARHGAELRAAIMVDNPVHFAANGRTRKVLENARAQHTFLSLESALEDYSVFASENLFIIDYIARHSVICDTATGVPSWTWAIDPAFWPKMEIPPIAPFLSSPQCPLALIVGADSALTSSPEAREFVRATAGSSVPWIEIPNCGHNVMVDQPLALVTALRALLAM
jgi:pimeloyl-ACP methyl ester carboxylesterase